MDSIVNENKVVRVESDGTTFWVYVLEGIELTLDELTKLSYAVDRLRKGE